MRFHSPALLPALVLLLTPASVSFAQVPQSEHEALTELYRMTDGRNWDNNSGWEAASPGTECSWFGISCEPGTGQRSVVAIALASNKLRGELPEPFDLPALEQLDLSDNALSGTIPSSLLALESLSTLDLRSNDLVGPLMLSALPTVTTLDLSFNRLFANSANVRQAIDSIQPGWRSTQTVAPRQVRVTSPGARSITVRWDPIEYTDDGGGYIVLISNSPQGPFREVQSTQTKLRSDVRVSGLDQNIRYHFAVATVTRKSPNNRNVLISPVSSVASLPEEGFFLFKPRRATARETQEDALVRVVRVGSKGAVSVDISTFPGTATADEDYLPAGTTLTWANGEEGPKVLEVPILDDTLSERSEFFGVTLSNPGGGALLPNANRTSVVIQDNDFPRRPRRQLTARGRQPAVAFDSDGRKLVAWEDIDGSGTGISAVLLSASGEPLGSPFRVNATQAGDQVGPDVAFAADGSFTIAWRNAGGPGARGGNGGNLVGSFFSPSAEPNAEEVAIDSAPTSASTDPQLGSSNEGEVQVTWQDGNGDVQTATVDREGSASEPTQVTEDVAAGTEPQTASSALGSHVIVWETSAAAKGRGSGLAGAFFAPGSDTPQAEFSVSSNATASSPSVAADDDGDFVVTWQQESGDGSTDIYARLYEAGGSARGPAFLVNLGTAGDQTNPRVGANSAGDFAVVWESSAAGKSAAGSSLVGAFFDPSGDAKSDEETIAEPETNATPAAADVTIDDDDEVIVVYELVDGLGETTGVFSEGFSSVVTPGICDEDDRTLCLNSGRFQVSASWRTNQDQTGPGNAVALSDDTGYFWFFDQNNVEITLKVLDGCAINDNYWVFAGGLTDVEVNVTITDTETGKTRNYINSGGTSFAPIQDTSAFDDCTGSSALGPEPSTTELRSIPRDRSETFAAHHTASATGTALAGCGDALTDALCLNQSRFAVTVEWATAQGTSGVGRPVTLTGDTGTFWFFDEQNVEVVIKVLDGCAINDSYWVFAAGLTNVEAELVVTDTQSLSEKRYKNDLGRAFQPIQDTQAFASCP